MKEHVYRLAAHFHYLRALALKQVLLWNQVPIVTLMNVYTIGSVVYSMYSFLSLLLIGHSIYRLISNGARKGRV